MASADGAEQRKPISAVILDLLCDLPLAGRFFKAYRDGNSTARTIILAVLLIGLVYPVYSMSVGLLFVRWLPMAMQTRTQDFILDSVGVNGRVDKSNLVIDASIPMLFTQNGKESYDERVTPDQIVKFEALVRRIPLSNSGAACFNVAELNRNDIVGTLTVYSSESTKQFTFAIPASFSELLTLGKGIDGQSWKELEEASPLTMPSYLLTVEFQPNPSLVKNSPFFKCYQTAVFANMNIFKPRLGTK